MPGKELVPRPAVQPPGRHGPPWQQSAAGETVPAVRLALAPPPLDRPACPAARPVAGRARAAPCHAEASYVLIAGGIAVCVCLRTAHTEMGPPGRAVVRPRQRPCWRRLWLWLAPGWVP